jgi:hypothetical protein
LSSPSTGSAAFQPVRPRKKRKDDRWLGGTQK